MNISLVGCDVNIGDKQNKNALGLIQFFYPNYKILQEYDYFPSSDKLIYVDGISYGNILNTLKESGKEVIYATTASNFDFDFTDNVEVLKFVFSKWAIDAEYLFSEDDIENIRRMELFDFYNFIKSRWVSKDICLCDETTDKINIHEIIGKGFNDIMHFHDYITNENANRLEMGFIQFIETARDKSNIKNKAYSRYNDLYRRFNAEFNNDYIALVLARYREMVNNKRFKLIWLLSQFSFEQSEGAL